MMVVNRFAAHTHDCNECVFIGQLLTTTQMLGVHPLVVYDRWDLYTCKKSSYGRPDCEGLVARYGPEGSHYVSLTVTSKDVLKAVARGEQFPLNVIAQMLCERELIAARAKCEVCKKPVREGLRFCSGLKGCFEQHLREYDTLRKP